MLLQFAGSFPLCSRKAASPLLTREARRPGRKGAQRIKTDLPPVHVQIALNNQIEKHTNEIKTFSKWAAVLRPDFMGPWPANLYLCLNWAPGKVAVGEARFWCQREGRTQPLEAGRPAALLSSLSCYLFSRVSPMTWLSVYKPAQTSSIGEDLRLTHICTELRTTSLT